MGTVADKLNYTKTSIDSIAAELTKYTPETTLNKKSSKFGVEGLRFNVYPSTPVTISDISSAAAEYGGIAVSLKFINIISESGSVQSPAFGLREYWFTKFPYYLKLALQNDIISHGIVPNKSFVANTNFETFTWSPIYIECKYSSQGSITPINIKTTLNEMFQVVVSFTDGTTYAPRFQIKSTPVCAGVTGNNISEVFCITPQIVSGSATPPTAAKTINSITWSNVSLVQLSTLIDFDTPSDCDEAYNDTTGKFSLSLVSAKIGDSALSSTTYITNSDSKDVPCEVDFNTQPLANWTTKMKQRIGLYSDFGDFDISSGTLAFDVRSKKYVRGTAMNYRAFTTFDTFKEIGVNSFTGKSSRGGFGIGSGSELVLSINHPEDYVKRLKSSSTLGESFIMPLTEVFDRKWYLWFTHFNTTAYIGFYCIPNDESIAPTTGNVSLGTMVVDQYVNLRAVIPMSPNQFLIWYSWNTNEYTETTTYQRIMTFKPDGTWFWGGQTNNPANFANGTLVIENGHNAGWWDAKQALIPLRDDNEGMIEWLVVNFHRNFNTAGVEVGRYIYTEQMWLNGNGSQYTNDVTYWTMIGSCVPSTDYGFVDIKMGGKYGFTYTSQTSSTNFVNRSYMRHRGRMMAGRNGNYSVGTYGNYILGSLADGRFVTLDFGLTRFAPAKLHTQSASPVDENVIGLEPLTTINGYKLGVTEVNIEILDYNYITGLFTQSEVIPLGKTLVSYDEIGDGTKHTFTFSERDTSLGIGKGNTTTNFQSGHVSGTGLDSGITYTIADSLLLESPHEGVTDTPWIQYPENVLYLDNNILSVRTMTLDTYSRKPIEQYEIYQLSSVFYGSKEMELHRLGTINYNSQSFTNNSYGFDGDSITTGILTTTQLQSMIDSSSEYTDCMMGKRTQGVFGKSYLGVSTKR